MRIADRPRLAARVVTHLTREITTGVVASGQGLREAVELRQALKTQIARMAALRRAT